MQIYKITFIAACGGSGSGGSSGGGVGDYFCPGKNQNYRITTVHRQNMDGSSLQDFLSMSTQK